jgi:hypothetical protein
VITIPFWLFILLCVLAAIGLGLGVVVAMIRRSIRRAGANERPYEWNP